jgi:hypothetical protein
MSRLVIELAFFENNALFASVSSRLMITALGGYLDCYSKSVAFMCTDAHDWGDLFWQTVECCGDYAPCVPKYRCHG